ncbi:hypothetical protein LshimejAT787_1000720 [Lyophyllum shimeji]|uniref:Uncharacterized protein n=1 Tax=Lyophyllum shimeji TaxID=47721 RepID=A0A9P3UQP7_LYOSH|nr:hypothetical protein LshimejAT787_1000720 [Lyophyllum shimeji]
MTVSEPFLASKALQLASVMAESFLLGSYFIVTLQISWLLRVKNSTIAPTHRVLFGASIFMFLISVVHLALVMQELMAPIIPKANGQAQVVLATVQYVTGDLILIWRVCVVWGFNYWVIVAPLVFLMAAAGLTLHQLAGNPFFNTASVALIVTNTSLCTALIFGRVWYVESKAVKAGMMECTTGMFKGSMILFIESGVLYAATQLLSLILNYTKAVALPLLLDLEMPLIGILPSLIIIVVHYDLRHGTKTPTVSPADRTSTLMSGDGTQLQHLSERQSPLRNTADMWLAHEGRREGNAWRV